MNTLTKSISSDLSGKILPILILFAGSLFFLLLIYYYDEGHHRIYENLWVFIQSGIIPKAEFAVYAFILFGGSLSVYKLLGKVPAIAQTKALRLLFAFFSIPLIILALILILVTLVSLTKLF